MIYGKHASWFVEGNTAFLNNSKAAIVLNLGNKFPNDFPLSFIQSNDFLDLVTKSSSINVSGNLLNFSKSRGMVIMRDSIKFDKSVDPRISSKIKAEIENHMVETGPSMSEVYSSLSTVSPGQSAFLNTAKRMSYAFTNEQGKHIYAIGSSRIIEYRELSEPIIEGYIPLESVKEYLSLNTASNYKIYHKYNNENGLIFVYCVNENSTERILIKGQVPIGVKFSAAKDIYTTVQNIILRDPILTIDHNIYDIFSTERVASNTMETVIDVNGDVNIKRYNFETKNDSSELRPSKKITVPTGTLFGYKMPRSAKKKEMIKDKKIELFESDKFFVLKFLDETLSIILK